MEIKLPSISDQQFFVLQQSTIEAIKTLEKNLNAPVLPGQTEINENDYPRDHLLREHEGWQAPHADIVGAYFRHFQAHFEQYNTDKKLAALMGLKSDRRIREFKQGKYKVPYNIWRNFLVITGRAPQEVLNVLAIVK